MDPITTAILAALAKLAEPAIKDSYEGLKAIIVRKFGTHHEIVRAVDNLEKKPDSAGRKETLKEEIVGSGAVADTELLAAANSLLARLKEPPVARRSSIRWSRETETSSREPVTSISRERRLKATSTGQRQNGESRGSSNGYRGP
jgi:disulfide oxidoreductase YuzD